ncbi:MAG: CYTH domain-containing protein [Patescibacteria group bacterium]
METEFEATFIEINKDEVSQLLLSAGATLVHPEFMMTREVFDLPTGHEIKDGWLRVRKEYDKITMSLKVVSGGKIENQKETCLNIDNFENAVLFLSSIGCRRKAYQESYRELWKLDDAEITIDEWPYLEPFVEVGGPSEEVVKAVSKKLGFDYNKAFFCSVDILYNRKYGTPIEYINKHLDLISFTEPNPFEDKK